MGMLTNKALNGSWLRNCISISHGNSGCVCLFGSFPLCLRCWLQIGVVLQDFGRNGFAFGEGLLDSKLVGKVCVNNIPVGIF